MADDTSKWKPVDESAWKPVADQPAMAPAAPQTIGHAASEALSGVNPFPGLWNMVRHPLDTITAATNARQAEQPKADEAFRQGHYVEGAGHWLAGKIPFIGPAAAAIGEQIGGEEPQFDRFGSVTKPGTPPDLMGGIGRGVGTIGGMVAAPLAARGVGSAVKAAARPLVNAGLGIPGKAAAWGKTPAQFIIENTSAVRPPAIAEQAQNVVNKLTGEQEAAAAASKTPAHLQPARDVVNSASTKAAGANSKITPRELAPMQRFLTEPEPGFTGATAYPPGANTPISFKAPAGFAGQPTLVRGPAPMPAVAEAQPALDLLHMRRQFGTDFVDNWNPTSSTKGALGTARAAYHALGESADQAIPGGAARDQLISSGIAAKDAADAAGLRATLGQRVLNRISRPTGGLVPMIIGYHEGGPLGAAAGLTGAEAAASPVPLMIGARGLHAAGRGIAAPLSQIGAQAAPLLRPRRQGEE